MWLPHILTKMSPCINLSKLYTHTHTYTRKCKCKCKMQIFLLPLGGHVHLAEPGCLCTLSRHCEPCKQSSWSRARNSQENRPFLTASGVGTQSPTWTIAVSWEKALNLHPSKCQVDWWGGRQMANQMEKLPELGLNSGPRALSPGHNHYTTQPHTHAHTHTPTHTNIH